MKIEWVKILILLLLGFCSANCAQQKQSASIRETNTNQRISELKLNTDARFRAVLRSRPGTTCIELFMPDEFEKYNGDSKWAAPAIYIGDQSLRERFEKPTNVIVSGQKKFVREVDSAENCDVNTGEVFIITSIETP